MSTLSPDRGERLRALLQIIAQAPGSTVLGELRAKPGPGARLRWAQGEAALLLAILESEAA